MARRWSTRPFDRVAVALTLAGVITALIIASGLALGARDADVSLAANASSDTNPVEVLSFDDQRAGLGTLTASEGSDTTRAVGFAVPRPGAIALLGLALAGLGVLSWLARVFHESQVSVQLLIFSKSASISFSLRRIRASFSRARSV